MEPFIHGVILAFGLILPLGVQNVFVFNQGATHSRFFQALPAVITAAICDTMLIALAVGGVSVVVLSFAGLRQVLFFAGFFFLLYMGWVMWKSNPVKEKNTQQFSTKRQITFALSVSLLNPHAILDTIGVIGTGSLVYDGLEKLVFALACILISWLWFIGLALTGRIVGRYDQNGVFLKRLNQLSAVIIWVMAVYIGYQFLNGIS
ncbi:LysE/ArgO family amino acid transporter [Ornithinibacillus bavariensis]|uniref:LysE/yggA protein n=1 Tax=Ornithinibacillus bavariensis TaxID=545502 RepID=A0A919X819_9BACI|nr:LysE family transporter [Ornithinibacillus bavariensis]GIO26573.1 LysE/yggA protein [Ornithinibacillus bavariensis]